MVTTTGAVVTGIRIVLRARWGRDAGGALVCRWVAEPALVPLAPATPFRLAGRRRLPARGAAMRALTAPLNDPPSAA
jgi:hypothetical protein